MTISPVRFSARYVHALISRTCQEHVENLLFDLRYHRVVTSALSVRSGNNLLPFHFLPPFLSGPRLTLLTRLASPHRRESLTPFLELPLHPLGYSRFSFRPPHSRPNLARPRHALAPQSAKRHEPLPAPKRPGRCSKALGPQFGNVAHRASLAVGVICTSMRGTGTECTDSAHPYKVCAIPRLAGAARVQNTSSSGLVDRAASRACSSTDDARGSLHRTQCSRQ